MPVLLTELSPTQFPKNKPLHLAIGMFDGVHLGHQAVIEAAIHSAHREEGISAVLSFTPHPSRLLKPESPVLQILTLSQKEQLIQALGINSLILQPFDASFAAMQAEDFLPYLKDKLPRLSTLYVGEQFRFGNKRAGDVGLLVNQGKNLDIDTFSLPQLKFNAEAVSSTRIRKALVEGQIKLVNELLGRQYTVEGSVIEGAKRGRILGFPTLNILWEAELSPRCGVYALRIRKKSSSTCPWQAAVANFGYRPTVGDLTQPLLEVHVLEETTLGYQDQVELAFFNFLREEMRFSSLEALKAAIQKDVQIARELFY